MAKNYLRREPGFYKRLFLLALPLILQNLITTSLGFVDTFMVGLLGQSELSAVTAANSPIFLIQVIVFGFISGLTVLTSQYWGKGDVEAINRCMGVALYIGVAVAAIMALVLFCFPTFVMGLVTNNTLLIEMGAPYLRIVGISYIFNAASAVYVGMQRSTENHWLYGGGVSCDFAAHCVHPLSLSAFPPGGAFVEYRHHHVHSLCGHAAIEIL